MGFAASARVCVQIQMVFLEKLKNYMGLNELNILDELFF
jgi:hypothetical protein